MQDKQQTNDVPQTSRELSAKEEKYLRSTASKKAFETLEIFHKHHLKVTEDELRVLATQDGTKSILEYESSYGAMDLAMPIFIEVFCTIWRDAGAVISQVEKDAIAKARQQKLKDAGPTYTDALPDELMIQSVARKHAVEYLLGETLAIDPPVSQVPTIDREMTEDQQQQLHQFEQAYLKEYRSYQLPRSPRQKLFGIF